MRESDTPDEAVMRSTYRALCEHGFASLTMQDIADETALSKAALHYRFGTKQELLEAFLDALTSWFEGRIDEHATGEDAPERLGGIVEACLSTPDTDTDADYPAFRTAMLEVKAQAPYEPAYRERLQAVDELLHERIRSTVADGVESGAFADVDPDCVARFLVTYLSGAHTRSVAVGGSLEEARADLLGYVETQLQADVERTGSTDPAAATPEASEGRPEANAAGESGRTAPREGTE